jgi:hypothetical protein
LLHSGGDGGADGFSHVANGYGRFADEPGRSLSNERKHYSYSFLLSSMSKINKEVNPVEFDRFRKPLEIDLFEKNVKRERLTSIAT